MSLQNAINFISNIDTDKDLRRSCYTCRSRTELLEMLKNTNRGFTPEEFANAINMLLFKCQTYEQADRVKELDAWFHCFIR
ncbi:MAG: hypothetical protein Q8904_14405 [Bacteroidota bacterium]|nr:hypothetical protein [Bacteroidota bacterium]